MGITLSAATFRRSFLVVIVCLTGLSLAGRLGQGLLPWRAADLLLRAFDVSAEQSVSTWYSAAGLALAAALLGLVAAAHRAKRETRDLAAWVALAVIFALLSCDEVAGLHEVVSEHLHAALGTSGFLRFAWVLPAGVFLLVLGATLLPFLARLAPRRRRQFVVAGLIYVGGAVGREMIGAKLFSEAGDQRTLAYFLCGHGEEFLEMLGIVLFNSALIEHLAETLGADDARLRFTA
ncbi:MAG: hypothetical protein Q8T11_08185 [Elusimicrobiota bacterium]|nr:hypothetical protein [Elusimicrobiota bacterium]